MMKYYFLFIALLGTLACGEKSGTSEEQSVAQPVTLSGSVEKGPFILGTSVRVSAMDAAGNPTGLTFDTQTTNDLGEFSVVIDYQGYAALEGSGYYFNELTGSLSGANLTLRAWVDIADASQQSTHINLVTHLTFLRVSQLIAEGMDLGAAILQAEDELREAMGITVSDYVSTQPGSDMRITGGDSADNAYLLAVSVVILQAGQRRGGSPDANVQEITNTIASDLAIDGTLEAGMVEELQAAMLSLNPDVIVENLENRFLDIGLTEDVPDFIGILNLTQSNEITDIVSGLSFSCALSASGDVHCETFSEGEDMVPPEGIRFRSIAASMDETCGITLDGDLRCWGTVAEYFPAELFEHQFNYVTAVLDSWCGATDENRILCWGGDAIIADQQLDEAIASLVIGANNVCGQTETGSSFCWPLRDTAPQATLPDGLVTLVSAFPLMALDADGQLTYIPFPGTSYEVPDAHFTQLSSCTTMENNTCGITTEGAMACWGESVNVTLTSEVPFGQSAVGNFFACGLRTDGAVICTEEFESPDGEFTFISVGGYHACGITTDGFMSCWE